MYTSEDFQKFVPIRQFRTTQAVPYHSSSSVLLKQFRTTQAVPYHSSNSVLLRQFRNLSGWILWNAVRTMQINVGGSKMKVFCYVSDYQLIEESFSTKLRGASISLTGRRPNFLYIVISGLQALIIKGHEHHA